MSTLKLPLGFRYSALYAGIRKQAKDDLSLIVSDTVASAAALFTTNRVQAAPVKLARDHLKASRGRVSGVLINAGNANCATRTGHAVALATSRALAKALDVPLERIIPASTGVIGVEMPADPIIGCLPRLVEGLAAENFERVADAILTTDLVRKTAWASVKGRGGEVRIAGMTKGSGMIQPLMATTLGFVMTDAPIAPGRLRAMLQAGIERSYNRLSVDGDTSTNDMVIVLANGASNTDLDERREARTGEALAEVLESLAEQIARDGEGASKLVRIEVSGAPGEKAAELIARSIANSPLVKTAIAGSDANWGRILSAAGNAGVDFDPSRADIWLQDVLVCRGGLAAPFDEDALKAKLDEKECSIRFSLRGAGKAKTRFWTCDFTEGYIRINASYRT